MRLLLDALNLYLSLNKVHTRFDQWIIIGSLFFFSFVVFLSWCFFTVYSFLNGRVLSLLVIIYDVSARLLKGFRSSGQRHLRIVIVLRAHTMSNTPYWYVRCPSFDKIDGGLIYNPDGLYIYCVLGEVQLWHNWWDRPSWRDIKASCGVHWWDTRKGPIKW